MKTYADITIRLSSGIKTPTTRTLRFETTANLSASEITRQIERIEAEIKKIVSRVA